MYNLGGGGKTWATILGTIITNMSPSDLRNVGGYRMFLDVTAFTEPVTIPSTP